MKYIGYHEREDLPIKPGDIVTIRKGTQIMTTHASGTKIAKRTYKIKVFDVLRGTDWNGEPHTNPQVRWPGSGGYWQLVDINDIPEVQDS